MIVIYYYHLPMSNECVNHILMKSDDPQVITTIQSLVISRAVIYKCGKNVIRFDYSTKHLPDYDWLLNIVKTYSCWVKNEWRVKDGKAGIWIGSKQSEEIQVKHMEWDDVSIEEELDRF